MKKTLIALALLGVAYLGAAWTAGRVAQHQIDAELARISALLPALKIVEDRHTRGVFGSTRLTTIDIAGLFDAAQCPAAPDPAEGSPPDGGGAPAPPPPAMGAPATEPLLLSLRQAISHGPLPGFGLPAAASVRYQWLLNGQPLADRLGIRTEGEMPVLTVRYGFTGNSRLLWSGGAGKIIHTGKDGKGTMTVAWPSLRVAGHLRSDLGAADYEGHLPALSLALEPPRGESLTISLKQLDFTGAQQYPIVGNPFVSTGSQRLRMAGLTAGQGGKIGFDAQGLDGKGSSTLDAGLLTVSTEISLASVKTATETAGPMHFDFTLAKLDALAYGQLMQSLMANDLGRCPSAEKTAAFLAQFSSQLPGLLKSGPEFRIDRLSLGYQGQEARLTGKLGLPSATAEQIENPAALMALASANLDLAVPDKLIQRVAMQSIGGKLAQELALAESADPDAKPTPAQRARAEAVAETMMAQQIEQALAKNWIVRGKDGVTSRLEYRDGRLVLNGQSLDLQGLRGGDAATVPAASGN